MMLSYHLLTRSLEINERSPVNLMRLAVTSAINGLVTHDTYVDAARRLEGTPPADKALASRIGSLLQFDVNPLMDLVRYCNDQKHFAYCWNQVNTKLQLGVATLFSGEQQHTTRLARQDEDTALRRRVVSLLIDHVSPGGAQAEGVSVARRTLCDVASDLDKSGNIYADLIGYLYEAPCADLGETISALGCSKRTLQRLIQSQGGGLTFMDVRQAVRICLSKELVRGTTLSFTEVAVNTGFYDAAHFCHAFYKSCGLSPSDYRKLARQGMNERTPPDQAPHLLIAA